MQTRKRTFIFAVALMASLSTRFAAAQYTVTLYSSETLVSIDQSGFIGDFSLGSGAGWIPFFYRSGTPAPLNMTPPGSASGFIESMRGGEEVGAVFFGNQGHAALWIGSNPNAVDLHPDSRDPTSQCYGTDGKSQVGDIYSTTTGPNQLHAMLWHGTAASAVDLHPSSAFEDSYAFGVDGKYQVGYAEDLHGYTHPMLWAGTARSARDLGATGREHGQAWAIKGNDVYGVAGGTATSLYGDAAHWTISPSTFTDLNPTWAKGGSDIQGIGGIYQCGIVYVALGDYSHAAVWAGTPYSALDLQQFLPSTFYTSTALAVSADGDVVGSAFDGHNSWGVYWHHIGTITRPGGQ